MTNSSTPNNSITINVNGVIHHITLPQQAAINRILNPTPFTMREREAHVKALTSRPEGATTQEIAIHYDTGEQNRYNPVVVKLEREGRIYRSGTRNTTSGRPANVFYAR